MIILDNLQHDASSVSSSSPPQFPTELSHPIPEESDEDIESVSHNEPVTPVSVRQSCEFPAIRTRDHDTTLVPFPSVQPEETKGTVDLRKGPFANADFQFPSDIETPREKPRPARSSFGRSYSTNALSPPATARTSAEDPVPTPSQDRRRSTRGSASSLKFKRTMSNLFSASRKHGQSEAQPQQSVMVVAQQHQDVVDAPRRWSMARSSATTPRSTTPPSPSSPTYATNGAQNSNYLTTTEHIEPLSKKGRSSTGLSFRELAVNFTFNGKNKMPERARASSFDGNKRPDLKNHHHPKVADPLTRNVFYQPAEAGVGVKARRLSLSLPDDFVIDIGDLTQEFEYQHKLFGRHRDGLGKGATAKVRVMSRKGFSGELYAVKEFRGKTNAETKEEYEKKVKSEYSISKSLHHPNIVETVRLCVDHGRWNHVMEYCSEGDLFGLVKKKYLRQEDRLADRLCLFKQLLQGLNYLHTNGIAHRDIKLENLLITKDSKLKITDFGVSEVFSGIHPGARESGGECGRQMGDIRLCNPGICGSEPYIAPEVLAKDKQYDARGLDVWGAAVVLIALIFGSTLWQKAKYNPQNEADQYNKLVRSFDRWNARHPDGLATISEDDYPRYYPFDLMVHPPPLRRVLLMMLNPNPEKRASISEVVNHRWVKNIECCQLESYDDPVLIIDATKGAPKKGTKKIFCHNHLPPKTTNTHSLGKMPGQAGY